MRTAPVPMLNERLLGKSSAIINTGSSYGYFIFVWLKIIRGHKATVALLWYPFISSSIIATIAFLISGVIKYNDLPESGKLKTPSFKELLKQRAQLALLHAPKNIFSGNILVPFFGYTMGVTHAATLKIISHIANSFRAITTSVIGFSGAAIFAKASQGSVNINRAFQPLWRAVIIILMVLSVIITTTIPTIVDEWHIGVIMAAFFSMAFLDYIFIIYEQMFLSQKRAYVLATIRTVEVLASYLMLLMYAKDPAASMGGIILFRIISFGVTVYYGYKYNNVWPNARVSITQIILAISIGIISASFIHIIRSTFSI